MHHQRLLSIVTILFVAWLTACNSKSFDVKNNLDYCVAQSVKTAGKLTNADSIPRSIAKGQTKWRLVNYSDWCSGFYPGILWYLYEYTNDPVWKARADSFSRTLTPLAYNPAFDHDLGFQLYCSFGNGLRLTGDSSYKRILLAAADTLATLFNPTVGTILSWPREKRQLGGHNTIIDNMINLELLFWASKNGGSQKLYDLAVQHANTTLQHHFRADNSSYHVIVYDTITGKPVRKITHQGYSDSSMWARGQSWAIYGFTMCYRETKNPGYLRFAQLCADRYLKDLPEDLIPYWDFNAPGIPNAPRDASAAAITASALLELSTLVTDAAKASGYRLNAEKMLASLSSEKYQGRNFNDAFLLHSTGHKPIGGEIDASIIYADYYYLEALLRLEKLTETKNTIH